MAQSLRENSIAMADPIPKAISIIKLLKGNPKIKQNRNLQFPKDLKKTKRSVYI